MKKLKALILTVVLIALLIGCGAAEKEYREDIVYPLKNGESFLIIKEWQYLLGSGEEIYYQQGNRSPVLLGELTGADDGFCPFAEGLYKITEEENFVTVSWYFSGDIWRSEMFELTEKKCAGCFRRVLIRMFLKYSVTRRKRCIPLRGM